MNRVHSYALMISFFFAGAQPGPAQEPAKPVAETAPPVVAPARPATSILEAIPADAAAIAVVRNGKEFSDKIMGILQELGLDKMWPIPQPLDLLKEYTGLGEGFIEAGAIGIAVMPFDEVDALPQHMGIFLPTTNLETMIAKMNPQPVEGENRLWRIQLLGEPSFVGGKKGFAVMAASKEIVKQIITSETAILSRISPERLEAFKRSDAMLWGGGESGGKLIQSTVAWFGEMQADKGAAAPELAGLDDLLKYSKDLAAVSVFLRLDDRGIGASFHADIKSGTELSRLAASQKSSDQPLLIGLPNERFVIAGGQMRSELGTVLGMKSLGAVFEMDAVKQMTDPEKLGGFREKLNGWLDQNVKVSFSLSLLPDGSDGMIGGVVVSENGDSQKWNDSFIQLIESGKAMVKSEELGQLLSLIQVKRDAEKIGEVSVHHVSIDLAKVEELPEAQVTLIKKLLGEEGFLIRLAAVGSHRNVLAFGGGQARMEKILALVKDQAAPLSGNVGVKLVNKQMPKARSSEVYVSIDTLSHLVKTFLDLYGMGDMLPAEIPELHAPITLVGSGEGDHLQLDFFLPMEAVVGIKDIALEAFGALGALAPAAAQTP